MLSITKFAFHPLTLQELILHLLSFDSMLITSCIWCSPLQHSLSRPPLVVFLLLHYRKKAQCNTKKTMEATTGLQDCYWATWCQPMTVLKTMQEEEYKILTPLFLITDPWLLALIYIIPQIPHGRRHSSSGRSLLCVIPSSSRGLKPPLYFLHAPSPNSLFGFSEHRKPRIWWQQPVFAIFCLPHLSSIVNST